jgi:Tol biopolymer transport system component
MKRPIALSLIIIGLIANLPACNVYNPVISKIAYISRDEKNKSQIFTINPDGNEISQLTKTGENFSPVWSPNGKKIAFSSSRNGKWEIFVMNNDGSNQIRLADGGGVPVWSPDGSKIAFISNRDNSENEFDLYVMNSDGTGQKRVTHSSGMYEGYSWSPDGQKIVFASIRPPPEVGYI